MSISRYLVTALVGVFAFCVFGFLSSFEIQAQSSLNEKMTIAQAKKGRAKSAPRKVREAHIVRQAEVAGQRKTKVDFDAIDIAGERKSSLGSIISESQADKNVDLIKIRLRWHPEMIQSTSSLETGRSAN